MASKRQMAVAALGLALLVLGGCMAAAPTVVRTEGPESAETADPERRANVRLELAAAYFQRGQNATALNELKQALAVNPNLVGAYNLRGLVLAAMGETGQAEESFKQALRLYGKDTDTLHNYGWFLCQQRRYDEAQTQFTQALEQPGYRDVARSLLAQGVCQARADRWADAEKSLLRAYEMDPANPVTAINLSEVLLHRNEFERARFYIRRVNAVEEQTNAQTLWLAMRIEQRMGQVNQVSVLGNQLRNRFPQSREALLYERGQFND